MFDIVKNIYQGDVFRPHIFGSLGTIAAGLRPTDLGSLSPELINFFPSQALSRLPKDVIKSITNEQLQNLNIEQIKILPNNLVNTLNKKQIAIIHQILYPFKSTEELIKYSQKSNSDNGLNESGTIMKSTFSLLIVWILPLISIIFMH